VPNKVISGDSRYFGNELYRILCTVILNTNWSRKLSRYWSLQHYALWNFDA